MLLGQSKNQRRHPQVDAGSAHVFLARRHVDHARSAVAANDVRAELGRQFLRREQTLRVCGLVHCSGQALAQIKKCAPNS